MQTQKSDTRKRILSVSKRLFLKKGFRETTTRYIAREAGINLSNLYHYFASKDELLRQLLKPATDTLEAMLNEHHGIKGEDILSIREDGYVEATLEEYLGAIKKYKSLLKLLLLKSQGSSLEGYKDYYVEKSTRLVLGWLKAMKEKHPEINTEVSDFFIHFDGRHLRRPFFVLEQNETLFTIENDIWIKRNRFCNPFSHTRGRERC